MAETLPVKLLYKPLVVLPLQLRQLLVIIESPVLHASWHVYMNFEV